MGMGFDWYGMFCNISKEGSEQQVCAYTTATSSNLNIAIATATPRLHLGRKGSKYSRYT